MTTCFDGKNQILNNTAWQQYSIITVVFMYFDHKSRYEDVLMYYFSQHMTKNGKSSFILSNLVLGSYVCYKVYYLGSEIDAFNSLAKSVGKQKQPTIARLFIIYIISSLTYKTEQ